MPVTHTPHDRTTGGATYPPRDSCDAGIEPYQWHLSHGNMWSVKHEAQNIHTPTHGTLRKLKRWLLSVPLHSVPTLKSAPAEHSKESLCRTFPDANSHKFLPKHLWKKLQAHRTKSPRDSETVDAVGNFQYITFSRIQV